jgi:hypothetical protein
VTQFHLINPDADDGLVVLLNLALRSHQCHGASYIFALIENLDAPTPSHLLAIVNLTQIQDMALDNAALGDTPVLHHTPILVLLAILFAPAASQKHDGAPL